mgnify:CR=1 FL=1
MVQPVLPPGGTCAPFVAESGLVVKPLSVQQCEHEMRMLRLIGIHPNIVTFVAAASDAKAGILCFEYGGFDLFKVIEQGGRPDDPRRVLMQVADALAHVHGKGVAHRDVKLENIVQDESGNVRLIDFGLSKAVGDVTLATRDGSLIYMAPEVTTLCANDACASDIWSLGVVLYGIQYGRVPFSPCANERVCATYRQFSDAALAHLNASRRCVHIGILPSILEPWECTVFDATWCTDPSARASAAVIRDRLAVTDAPLAGTR